MNHFVTCYYEINGEVEFKAVLKQNVPQFVEEHKESSCIIVCDPRNRETTYYEYGQINNLAG